MKHYRIVHDVIFSADVPDGSVCLELGAHLDGGRITAIDLIARMIRIDERLQRAFPAVFYRIADVEWSPVRYRPLATPPDVLAKYDALSDERKADLRREASEMMDGLCASIGVSRVVP